MSGARVWVLAALVGTAAAHDCPSVAGPVVGSIFGTLAFVAIVLGIIALVYHLRKRKDKKKLRESQKDLGHQNPTFTGDSETGNSHPVTQAALTDKVKAEGGFGGYVECREYDSPVKSKVPAADQQNGSGPTRSLFLEESISQAASKGQVVTRTGSSGSLDNCYPPTKSQVVMVPLLSQDIMGLGFNVDGTLKDGIFVSKIHQRGPAHETGLISLGDRILSVTVSFENMVLEDAMTILSYASPYPVKLCLEKFSPATAAVTTATDMAPGGESVEDEDNINHPVYRSQSLDDLRQIGREGLLHPRRTYSEMKHSGYVPSTAVPGDDIPDASDGQLKKWKGREDMVREDLSEPSGDVTSQSAATSSLSIPDLKVDMSDLRMTADDVTNGDMVTESVQVHVDGDRESLGSDGGSGTIKDELKGDLAISADSLNVEQDIVKKEIITSVNTMPQVAENGDAMVTVTIGAGEDTDKDTGSDSGSESDKVTEQNGLVTGVKQEDIEVEVNGSPSESSDEKAANGEQTTVGDVIRDYFGNNPNILEQFGLPSDAEGNDTMEVTTDGATVTRTERVETADGVMTTTTVETTTEVVAGSPDSGLGARPSLDAKHSSSSSSSVSSPSSRSESPTVEAVHINDTSLAPAINKTGGVSFNISGKDGPDTDTPKSKGSRSGVAYYYSIDQHGSPAHSMRPLGSSTRKDLEQPELIRPDPDHVLSTTSRQDDAPDNELDVNDNSQQISQLKKSVKLTISGASTDDGVSLTPTDNASDALFDKDSVSVVKQTDVVEAYTVTVKQDDSVA